ncbi:MAG TPA: PAS domain-containing protein, partial [Spirochaetia bacterium]|nr:PAS domain-containing protein [Spirochaetia bacterium]
MNNDAATRWTAPAGAVRVQDLFDAMEEGFALHEIILDADGNPVDYRFLTVNHAFERQSGLTASTVIGRTVREVLPGIERIWIERYGRVALTGHAERFEESAAGLGRRLEVSAYCPS